MIVHALVNLAGRHGFVTEVAWQYSSKYLLVDQAKYLLALENAENSCRNVEAFSESVQ